MRGLPLQGAVPLCGVLSKTGTGEKENRARTLKGGFIIDFSYRRKAQCGADYRCRTWGKGKERRISHRITKYYGIVTGETIIGANLFRDFFASIRDIVGGRSGSYEEVLRQAKDTALREMQDQAALLGANAVVGVDLDYETVGDSGSMLMVTASGTAVRIED